MFKASNLGWTWNLDSKKLKRNLFIMITAMVVIVWNIGSYNLITAKGINLFDSNNPIGEDPSTNIDDIIDPPLGNQTSLPSFGTLFTLMVFNFPIEIVIVFIAEIFLGSILRAEKKRLSFIRLLILLGSSLALTVGTSVVHYVAVWPAMHDWPIHQGYTFNDTQAGGILVPQYGGAETFFSKGVGVILFLVAAIVIVGMHLPVFKYLLKMSWLQTGVSLGVSGIYYFIIWFTLARKITTSDFWERTGRHYYLSLIFASAIVIGVIVLLLWNYTLEARAITKEQSQEEAAAKMDKV
ncbi:MAG: hypothetical protein FK733_01315 [Asgard group archaeon]|nr:hypothetical protein [Asgard group archaeon]